MIAGREQLLRTKADKGDRGQRPSMPPHFQFIRTNYVIMGERKKKPKWRAFLLPVDTLTHDISLDGFRFFCGKLKVMGFEISLWFI